MIILTAVAAVTFVIVFIASVASMQELYRSAFPGLVGAATSSTESFTSYTRPTRETTTTTTTTTETTTTETTPLAPITVTTSTAPESSDTSETTPATTQNNEADPVPSSPDVIFTEWHDFEKVSYGQRALLLENMKSSVDKFISEHKDLRITFRYENMKKSESLGLNDIDPIVPSGSISMPVATYAYERIAAGTTSSGTLYTYEGNGTDLSSYIAANYKAGKKFYLGTLINYAIVHNDSVALDEVIKQLGGLEQVAEKISEGAILPYNQTCYYTDYKNQEYKGKYRTSTIDMSSYAKNIYFGFINDSKTYKPLICDLYASQIQSPIGNAFPETAQVFHSYGINQEQGAHIDVAIINYREPITLTIYVEGKNDQEANEAIKTMAGYVREFLDNCYR